MFPIRLRVPFCLLNLRRSLATTWPTYFSVVLYPGALFEQSSELRVFSIAPSYDLEQSAMCAQQIVVPRIPWLNARKLSARLSMHARPQEDRCSSERVSRQVFLDQRWAGPIGATQRNPMETIPR
jgi:hypothetical protein